MIRLTRQQRRLLAGRVPEMADRLLLDANHQRSLDLAPDELRFILATAKAASGGSRNGMERNSWRHIADAAEKGLLAFRLFELEVVVRHIRPPIWRCIRLPDCSLIGLHKAIQAAFGWWDYHLYLFEADGVKYGDIDLLEEDAAEFGWEDARDTRLSDLFAGRRLPFRFLYNYDFGDNWDHDVVIERVLDNELGASRPVCVGGARAGPPEDVGGTHGYEEYLEALRDPKHEQHREMRAWRGRFDPEAFDIEAVNAALRKVKLK
jgi:hypothetical protein